MTIQVNHNSPELSRLYSLKTKIIINKSKIFYFFVAVVIGALRVNPSSTTRLINEKK